MTEDAVERGDEPEGPTDGPALPPHLAALIGALDGPADLARHHDKYLAYPDREEHGGAASA
jgi:hypothetical protein